MSRVYEAWTHGVQGAWRNEPCAYCYGQDQQTEQRVSADGVRKVTLYFFENREDALCNRCRIDWDRDMANDSDIPYYNPEGPE